MEEEVLQSKLLTGAGDGDADLFWVMFRSFSLEGLAGFSGHSVEQPPPPLLLLLSVTMAFSCFNFSSFTHNLFCISSCLAFTRLS